MKLQHALLVSAVCCFTILALPSLAATNGFVGVSAGNTFSWSVSGSGSSGSESATISGRITLNVLSVSDVSSTESQVNVTETSAMHISNPAMSSYFPLFPNETNMPINVYNGTQTTQFIIAKNANKTLSSSGYVTFQSMSWDSNGILSSENLTVSSPGLNVSYMISRISSSSSMPGYSMTLVAGSIFLAAISFAVLFRKKIRVV